MVENFKEKVFKAQRMYYLSQKLGDRVPKGIVKFSKDNLNRYIRLAKELELRLTPEEMYHRLFKE